MTFGFQNLVLLFGLAAVTIPLLIHLLNRRRYNVVAWGAMQFLQVSRATRRRLRLEELLLLLLRMGLIAVLVLALAGPYGQGRLFSAFADRAPRDIVIIVDGSASMAREGGKGPTPFDAAKAWTNEVVDGLTAADRVALLLAREQPVALVPMLTPDHAEIRSKLTSAAAPGGSCDLPRALEEAHRILTNQSKQARQEIILITDGQRWGWADPEVATRWDRVARLFTGAVDGPHILAVHLPPRDAVRSNFSLAPITTMRATAWSGQQVICRAALRLDGFSGYQQPSRIRMEIDGRSVEDLTLPQQGDLAKGQIGLRFAHRFTTPASHVVSVIVEPDLPPERRPADYRVKDCLPADNRQDFALTVHDTLPVLLVDGDREIGPESPTFFVQKALEQSPDPKRPPVVLARVVSSLEFRAEMLKDNPERPRPRVVVLADVPRLTEEQQEAIEQFLRSGGGVLVAVGERVERDAYNNRHFRNGEAFLPARLESVAEKKNGASPDVRRMQHPSLRVFAEESSSTLSQARLPRWWKVAPAKNASVGAMLDSEDPLLIERSFAEGRVLLWTAPLDRSWGSNLPGVLEYPVLIHELVGYLADGTQIEQNVGPGQPLRYRPRPEENVRLPARLVLQPPHGEPQVFRALRWPWSYDGARIPGVYRLSVDGQRTMHYVVQPDPREYDLTPCTEEDRQRVARIIPLHYGDKLPEVAEDSGPQELWWLFLVAVSVLLCVEVWMTRRMLAAQHGAEA